MCGVFSIFGSQLSLDSKRQLTLNAVAQLEHRGPDAWGIFNSPAITLGHVRLSIVDLAAGHQPMVSNNGDYVVSFNGEIYNHIELRAELQQQGYTFSTRSDTEVILKAYERDGADCFKKFNGQFAILLWDKQKQELVAARDRYGIRPLYVLPYQGGFCFSSEMKAFDALPEFTREFSPTYLLEHALLWNTLGQETVYKNIKSVESGTYHIYALDGNHKVTRYYQVGEELEKRTAQFSCFEEAQSAFKQQLGDAVELRLRSDVPVGAYLSGGIDSTVISRLVKDRSGHDFTTFSVAFADETLDESHYQKMASNAVHSIHTAIEIDRKDIANSIVNTVKHTERPTFRTAPVPLHLLSKKVKESDIKVVLTGEGADEILCGYDAFKELKILDEWNKNGYSSEVEKPLKDLYPHLAHYSDPKHFGLIKLYYEGFLKNYSNPLTGLNIRVNNNKIIEKYLNKDWNVTLDKEQLMERLGATLPKDFNSWTLMQRNSFLEIKTLMQGYLLSSQGDRMALSNSVEGRFPFLDHNVVEMAFALPDEYKLQGFRQKHILQEAFRQEIPEAITNRPKRPYMAPDLISFFNEDGSLEGMAADLMSKKSLEDFGLFDHQMVEKFLRKFRRGVPKDSGYRDNMIFTFIYTTQLCQYWIANANSAQPDYSKCTVDITEEI